MQSALEVITPASSQDLISLHDFRSELNITDDGDDLKLQRWISDASARICDFCGRQFRLEEVREIFWSDGHGVQACLLSRAPVINLASVTENGAVLHNDRYRLRGNRLWKVSGATQIPWLRIGEIEIIYSGGYAALTDVPRILRRACLKLASESWFSAQRSPTIRSESVEIVGVETVRQDYVVDATSSTQELPPDIMASLWNYRVLSL